ncbi:hypothetical protein JW835_05090 [bacterium]|nr:hypothetical protein [bacterium]
MDKVKADPKYRKHVLIKGTVYLTIALVLVLWIVPQASEHLMQTNPPRAFLFLETIIFLILLLMILSWINVLRVGIQSIRQKQYPPKDVPVFIDTIVITDKKAVTKGKLVIGSALLAIALSVCLCVTLAVTVFSMF